MGDAGILIDLDNIAGMLSDFYEVVASLLVTGTEVSFDGIWTEVMDPEPTQVEGETWSQEGIGGMNALPRASAICVGWRTALATRKGRGRTFLNPITWDMCQDDGTIATTPLAGIRAAAAALVEASDSFANGALGVYSRDAGGVPPVPSFRDFTSSQVRDTFAVLRSRRD